MTPREREDLSTFQIKELAQVWLEKWRNKRQLRDRLVDWKVLKEAFVDRFFPLEWREKKMMEFMNLNKGDEC